MTGKTINPRTNDRMPGWFSWRHQTNTAHIVARENYLAAHGPAARRARAAERLKSSPAT